MLIKNTAPCFATFGEVTMRPGSTEVVPDHLADRKDFQDAVKHGKIVVMSKGDGATPNVEGGKPWENLKGPDLIDYVEGLFDLAELKEFEAYSSSDKTTQAAVRKAARAKVKEIEEKKAEAGA